MKTDRAHGSSRQAHSRSQNAVEAHRVAMIPIARRRIPLFRSIRSATVIASTPVEALVLTHGSLARASKKNPAIGSRLLLNLARVLSQRLDSLTRRLSETTRREIVDQVFS